MALGLIGVLLTGPIALDEDRTSVRLEVELPDQDGEITDPSGLVLRIGEGDLVLLRLRSFEESDRESPADVSDPTHLLEIRDADEETAVRLGDWNRVRAGVYETSYDFGGVGRFKIIVLPDIEDRAELPQGSTDELTVIVEADPVVISQPDAIGMIAIVVTVVLVGVLVFMATWRRRREPKGPVPQDSWWNPP